MSSDSESFTSHSGIIEHQLDTALEHGGARNSRRPGGESQKQGVSASGVGFFDQTDSNSDQSEGNDDVEDELQYRDHHVEDDHEAVDSRPSEAIATGVIQQEDADHGVEPRRIGSVENRMDDDGIGNSHTATDSWAINSPYVESVRHDGAGRDFELRTLSRQLCKKSARRGYDFKLMLVGESGIGKTTLIDSLFNVESTRNLGSQYVRSQRDTTTTTKLCERFFELEEGGVSVRLTVIDTPGFATELDSTGCVQPVLNYVERQLDEYFRMEQGTDRTRLHDGRVHALLYVINPSGLGLKQVDLMCLKALHNKVNIVPVIGKADTLTPSEKAKLKASILQDIKRNSISVYTLPEFDDCFGQSEQDGDDVYLRNQHDSLKAAIPLAVVGSNLQSQGPDGNWVRAREYPWGIVDIDNPEYSDFLKLRELLIMYMEDFKERTHEVIYEGVRLSRLRQADTQISRMSKTIVERERLLQEKDEELRRLREAVESLQHAGTNSKSLSLPSTALAQKQPTDQSVTVSSNSGGSGARGHASVSDAAGRSASGPLSVMPATVGYSSARNYTGATAAGPYHQHQQLQQQHHHQQHQSYRSSKATHYSQY